MFARIAQISPFARHMASYVASEAAAKASRLLVVVAVARTLSPLEIGIAAGALAASDILKALTENGVGQKIIAAKDEDLDGVCRTAHRLFWIWNVALFLLQIAVGIGVYAVTGNLMLLGLIFILAGEYLFMPGGLVQCALAMRSGKMHQTAAIAGGQIVGANLMTAALAFLWPSPLALVLPKLICAPIWLIAMRRLHPWQANKSAKPAPWRPFVSFGLPVLGVEIARALRLQSDKLIIGALLGAETLGIYFMAFNAGLGLATSFSVAFSTVLFPHLCRSDDRSQALRQALMMALGVIAPIVVLQALAAPLYVPILYGNGWDGISGVVSILCLAAIPGVIWAAAAQWLRAEGRPNQELYVTVSLTIALTLNAAILAPYGLTVIAIGYLVLATVIQVGAAAWILSRALPSKLQTV